MARKREPLDPFRVWLVAWSFVTVVYVLAAYLWTTFVLIFVAIPIFAWILTIEIALERAKKPRTTGIFTPTAYIAPHQPLPEMLTPRAHHPTNEQGVLQPMEHPPDGTTG